MMLIRGHFPFTYTETQSLRKLSISYRERLLKSNVLLFKRERQMVYELSCIYSIEEVMDLNVLIFCHSD